MSSIAIAILMFVCVLTATLVAMMIARRLPTHHLSGESREVVKMGLGTIGTLTALVLGLLVAATKGTFDAQSGTLKDFAAQVALEDRILARYGPEANAAREQLQSLAQAVLVQLWPNEATTKVNVSGGESRTIGEALFESVSLLEPSTDSQRLLKSRAQDIIVGMGQLRQRLVVNNERTIPLILLIMLGIWQGVLFAGFGLLAPRNATTIAVLVICMISVSGALFLVMELDRPLAGIVRISDSPLRSVISHLGE